MCFVPCVGSLFSHSSHVEQYSSVAHPCHTCVLCRWATGGEATLRRRTPCIQIHASTNPYRERESESEGGRAGGVKMEANFLFRFPGF